MVTLQLSFSLLDDEAKKLVLKADTEKDANGPKSIHRSFFLPLRKLGAGNNEIFEEILLW